MHILLDLYFSSTEVTLPLGSCVKGEQVLRLLAFFFYADAVFFQKFYIFLKKFEKRGFL